MSKDKSSVLPPAFTDQEVAKIISAIGGDGHSIYNTNKMAAHLGIDPSKFSRWHRNHKSGKDFKSVISDSSGKTVDNMDGVWGLNILEGILSDYGLPATTKFGRGSAAREATSAIINHLKSKGIEIPREE